MQMDVQHVLDGDLRDSQASRLTHPTSCAAAGEKRVERREGLKGNSSTLFSLNVVVCGFYALYAAFGTK